MIYSVAAGPSKGLQTTHHLICIANSTQGKPRLCFAGRAGVPGTSWQPSWALQAGRWDGIWNKCPIPKLEILCQLTCSGPYQHSGEFRDPSALRVTSCHITKQFNALDTWVVRTGWLCLFPVLILLPQPCRPWCCLDCGRWSMFIAFGDFNEPASVGCLQAWSTPTWGRACPLPREWIRALCAPVSGSRTSCSSWLTFVNPNFTNMLLFPQGPGFM